MTDVPQELARAVLDGLPYDKIRDHLTVDDMAHALAAVLPDIAAERNRLAAQVAAVRALHLQDDGLLAPGKWCPACGDETPCATIRALDADQAPPTTTEETDRG